MARADLVSGQDLSLPSTLGSPALRVRELCKEFAGHMVVDHVSLDVAAAEVVAVIGPSGAGKSTLVRCINHLEEPTAGDVSLQGKPVGAVDRHGRRLAASPRQLAELRRSVGMVFQSFNLFPHLTVLDNVVLGQVHALGRSRRDAEQRAQELLVRVGLDTKLASRPHQLSGGQQQRVAIARALALDPAVMLFDEPTSALDPELGMEVLTVMRQLASEGMTMIVVTHEMHFAMDVADRVVVMADGRLIEEGTPNDVLRKPQHSRTQRFLGAVLDR